MANPKILKETLDAFLEKEALVEAEIQQSEEQIVELETRIVECAERLKTVELDRDHVMEIMKRYAPKSTGGTETKAASAKAPPAASKAQQSTSTGTAKPIKEPPKASPKAQPAAEEKKPAEAEAAEGDDDTVKNINDALRGLFR